MIAPPYSVEFIGGMLPIVKNDEVTSALKMADAEDDVSKFLGKICHMLSSIPSTFFFKCYWF